MVVWGAFICLVDLPMVRKRGQVTESSGGGCAVQMLLRELRVADGFKGDAGEVLVDGKLGSGRLWAVTDDATQVNEWRICVNGGSGGNRRISGDLLGCEERCRRLMRRSGEGGSLRLQAGRDLLGECSNGWDATGDESSAGYFGARSSAYKEGAKGTGMK